MENVWKKILRYLYKLDNLLHVVIAVCLLFFAFVAVFKGIYDFKEISYVSIINSVSDIFLALILAELLWPVLKFLKKEEFSLNPFLFVGIISATRKLLLLEAKQAQEGIKDYHIIIEQGVTIAIILILIIVYYIYSKTSMKKE